MSIYFTCLVSWILYCIFRYTSKKTDASGKASKFTTKALIKTSVTAYFKKFTLIAAVLYSCLSIVIFFINTLPDLTQNQILSSAVVSFISGIKSFNENFEGSWKVISLILLVFFVIAVIYRVNKSNVQEFINRLVKKYNDNELEELEDTEEMEKIKASILSLDKDLQKLNKLQPLDQAKFDELELKKDGIRATISKDYQALTYADFLRRLEKEIDDQPLRYSKSSRLNRIILFFTSAGMFTSVKKVNSVLSASSTALLLLALLTVQTGQFAEASSPAQVKWETIVIGNKINKLDGSLKSRLSSKKSKLSAEEQRTVSEFSHAMEREIMRSFLKDTSETHAQNFRFVSTYVRENVLHKFANHKQVTGDPHFYQASEPFKDVRKNGASDIASDLSERFEATADPVKPTGKYAAKIEEDITGVLEHLEPTERASVISQFKSYLHSFKTPASMSDVVSMAYDNLFDHAVSDPAKEFIGKLTGDEELAGKIANQATSKINEKLFNNNFEFKTKNMLTSVLIDKKTVEQSMAQVRDFHINIGTTIPDQVKVVYQNAGLSSKIGEIADNLKKAPPTVTYSYLDEKSGKKMAEQLSAYADDQASLGARSLLSSPLISDAEKLEISNHLDEVKDYYKENVQEKYRGGLTGYEDYFPSHLSGENSTVYAQDVKPVLAAEGSALETGVSEVASNSEEIFSDAFNFLNLLGNRRIGGVLIGREPQNNSNSTLNLQQIRWKTNGSSIDISTEDAQGHWTLLGHFDKNIVAQAIAYAADSRPIATTMIKIADKLPLKVMVHPSLANTPLGCKIINLDRFVDTYVAGDPLGTIAKDLELFQYEEILYDGVAYNIILNRQLYDQKTQPDVEAAAKEYAAALSEKFNEIRVKLNNGALLNDTLFSPMRAKQHYYNQKIIDKIVIALGDNRIKSFDDLLGSIMADLPQEYQAKDILITDSEVWSGVRENPYSLDKSQSAFQYNSSDDPFKTLSFIEQVAYKKSMFTAMDSTTDFHPERDSNPWEFVHLKKANLIQTGIEKLIQADANREIITSGVEFTRLQRLFRTAFNGGLGLDFPVGKLGDLMDQCIGEVYYVKTPEWSQSYKVFDKYLRKTDPKFLRLLNIMGINNEENSNACH